MSAPRCHPERRHHARGLCSSCYLVDWRAERRRTEATGDPRVLRTVALLRRAERIRAELEAAGPYANRPATWRGVAEELGIKHETLTRTLSRARRYSERMEEAS